MLQHYVPHDLSYSLSCMLKLDRSFCKVLSGHAFPNTEVPGTIT